VKVIGRSWIWTKGAKRDLLRLREEYPRDFRYLFDTLKGQLIQLSTAGVNNEMEKGKGFRALPAESPFSKVMFWGILKAEGPRYDVYHIVALLKVSDKRPTVPSDSWELAAKRYENPQFE